MEKVIGETVSHCCNVVNLGGGMGVVYKAKDTRLRRLRFMLKHS
jgi:hypothetical protein